MHRAHDAGAVCRLDRWESICGREDAWMGRTLTSKAPKIGISAVRNLGGALAEVQAVLAAGLLAAPVESVDGERSEERRAWAFFAKFAGHSEAALEVSCCCTAPLHTHSLAPPPSGRAQISSQKGRQAAHRTASDPLSPLCPILEILLQPRRYLLPLCCSCIRLTRPPHP